MRHYRALILLLTAMLSSVASGGPAWAAAERVAYLINIGWHVGIALPVDAALRRNLPEVAGFPGAKFLEFGWGDETFYRAKNPTTAMAIDAALSPGPAVIHVYGFSQTIEATFPGAEIIAVPIDGAGFTGLLRHLHKSFARNGDGSARMVGPGLYGGQVSRFYAATGRFHLLRTCNTWAAETLAAAGLAIEPGGIITAGGLLGAVREALAPP